MTTTLPCRAACYAGMITLLLGLIPIPAYAQGDARHPQDIVGVWMPAGGGPTFQGWLGFQEDTDEREHGPSLVEYAGIPLSPAGLARALSYDPSLLSVPEHQCMPHPATYSLWGPPDSGAGGPRITSEVNERGALVAYRVDGMFGNADRIVWMDGRPHPSTHAAHTWAGFTTGRWVDGALETTTTHLKWGWIKRNGVYVSDLATVVTRYARHGDVLTITVLVNDPIYLTEPFVRTIDFIPWTRPPARRPGGGGGIPTGSFRQCYPTEETGADVRRIPSHLPWANPFVTEEEERYRLPPGAVLGGAATALPDFIERRARQPASRAPTRRAGTATPTRSATAAPVEVLHVQGNVWMLVSQGINLAVQVGDEGVVLVDTGLPGSAVAILAAIRTITDKPIRYIINTSAAPERIGNNEVFATLAGGATSGSGQGPTPAVIAHEQVLTRMTASDRHRSRGWPTDAYLFDKRSIHFNGEAIDILHQPGAYSDGDSIVHFRRSDVVVAGRVMTTTHFPRFDPGLGGSYDGVLNSLNAMLAITVPRWMQEGGTYIIPGQGRISDEADLAEVRDQVQMVKDRFVDLAMARKLSLEQARQMNMHPLIDLEQRYNNADWTTEEFSAALYREITAER